MREKFFLNIITPVFIGSNHYLSPYSDYFYFNNKVYYIFFNNLVEMIPNYDVNKFLQNFYTILNSNKERFHLYEILRQLDIDPVSLATYAVPCLINPENRNIRETVSTSDKIFIPGSSIKGAFRNAILYDYLNNTEEGKESFDVFIRKLNTVILLYQGKQKEILNLESSGKNLKSYKEKQSLKRKIDFILHPLRERINTFIKFLESDLFGNGPDFDFMKLLAVSDSNAIPKEQSIYIEEINRIRIRDKKIIGTTQVAEVIKNKLRFEFSITLNTTNGFIPNLKYFSNLDIHNILKMVHAFSKDQIRNEIDLYGNDRVFRNAVSFINGLLEHNNNAYLIRIGANKTFLFNTISSLIPANSFRAFREIMRIGENPFTGRLVRGHFPSTQRFISSNNNFVTPGWCSINSITN